jgi:hypothetical protein
MTSDAGVTTKPSKFPTALLVELSWKYLLWAIGEERRFGGKCALGVLMRRRAAVFKPANAVVGHLPCRSGGGRRELSAQAIQMAQDDQAKAAQWLGISRPTMRDKLRRPGLSPQLRTRFSGLKNACKPRFRR